MLATVTNPILYLIMVDYWEITVLFDSAIPVVREESLPLSNA